LWRTRRPEVRAATLNLAAIYARRPRSKVALRSTHCLFRPASPDGRFLSAEFSVSRHLLHKLTPNDYMSAAIQKAVNTDVDRTAMKDRS
jgi:hypothetical protein